MSLCAGQASEQATATFRDRAVERGATVPEHFREGPGHLVLSSMGLGTYLGEVDLETDLAVEEAVSVSVRSGRINVLDTAINYRLQRAERSVGRALRRLLDGQGRARAELFIATKNGYLAPDSESELSPQRYVETELLGKGILRPSEIVGGSHAMSVPFLRDQFERSRQNLGLDVIDLVYLHNAPEAQIPLVGRAEFLQRLELAFEFYESLRKEGKLGHYGLATWSSLRSPRGAPEYLSIEEAMRAARRAGGGDHGFRFLQFPFNIAMAEAAVLRCQPIEGERRTLFEAARSFGLGCFTSVPLLQGELARRGPAKNGLSRAQTAIQFARSAPGTLGPLVGQKAPDHLAENLVLAGSAPWDEAQFRSLL